MLRRVAGRSQRPPPPTSVTERDPARRCRRPRESATPPRHGPGPGLPRRRRSTAFSGRRAPSRAPTSQRAWRQPRRPRFLPGQWSVSPPLAPSHLAAPPALPRPATATLVASRRSAIRCQRPEASGPPGRLSDCQALLAFQGGLRLAFLGGLRLAFPGGLRPSFPGGRCLAATIGKGKRRRRSAQTPPAPARPLPPPLRPPTREPAAPPPHPGRRGLSVAGPATSSVSRYRCRFVPEARSRPTATALASSRSPTWRPGGPSPQSGAWQVRQGAAAAPSRAPPVHSSAATGRPSSPHP
mmetsp:Transcript_91417/g.186089  ORF Transcript_91417/g.186089 Transcript_91417/m.186089 type:complete len:297 (-) Transcript_91417:107-997(-)